MRIFYITTILCLGAHALPDLKASGLFPDEEGAQGKNLPSQRQGETPPPQRLSEDSAMGQWCQYIAKENAPLSRETLIKGQNIFAQKGEFSDWIAFLMKSIVQSPIEEKGLYFDALVSMTERFTPENKRLSTEALKTLFKDTESVPRAARQYLKLITILLTTQTAAQQISYGNARAKCTFISGFTSLCAHYMERLFEEKSFSREKTAPLAQLILDTYASPYSIELSTENGWDRKILKTVLRVTHDFSPEERLYLYGFLNLARIEASLETIPNSEAREIIETYTPYLTCQQSEKPHAAWAFPLLATAYHTLNKSQECIQVWEAYERCYDRQFKWSYKELSSALGHITLHANNIQTIDHWWERYQKENRLNMRDFQPTHNDLNITTSVSCAYVRLGQHAKNEILTRIALGYLNNADTSCATETLKSEYSVQHLFLSLSRARSFTQMGRYAEAAALYCDFFEVDNNKLSLKEHESIPKEQLNIIKRGLKHDIKCAVIAFSQAGPPLTDAHADSQEGPNKKINHKSNKRLGKETGASSRTIESFSVSSAAKEHLMKHHKERLQGMDQLIEEMGPLARQLELPAGFFEALTFHKNNINKLQAQLTLLSAPPSKKKRSSSQVTRPPEATPQPTIGEIGTKVDDVREALQLLEKEFQNAHELHKKQRQKELNAYLARMSANDDELKHFTPEPVQESHSPKPKQKKKTRPNGRGKKRPSGPPLPSPPMEKQEPTPLKATLFMKKKADADYTSLLPPMHRKFHTLAREIAKNPYQVLGGLGRPERLVSKNGVYFSRHLNDVDRVVYEVLKDEKDSVSVVFLSLRGHYENLARHKESTHVHPFVSQKESKESHLRPHKGL